MLLNQFSIRIESFSTEYKTLFLVGKKKKKTFNKHPNCLCLPSNFGFREGNSATTPTDMHVITARFSEPFLNRNTQQPDRLLPALLWDASFADVENKGKYEQYACLPSGDPDQ